MNVMVDLEKPTISRSQRSGNVPGHSHACVSLALGYRRAGDLPRAREYTMQALAADPRNPVALKNMGAILGKEGDALRALYYLRQSFEINPLDPQTVHGLTFSYILTSPEFRHTYEVPPGFRAVSW